MARVYLDLKIYQQNALDQFSNYLNELESLGTNLAFYKSANLPYREAPAVADGTPYVCLRIPTGGGKTIMASHAVGIAAKSFLQTSNPMVLWLVPSTPILDQTITALKNEEHPYRTALARDFGRNISILTKAEALSMSRADAEGGACIIVSTIQSFRRRLDNGKENPEGLKVYQDAGALMDHFSSLSDDQKERLDKVEGTDRPVASLANLLKLHRPMVIVDEAHNARTSLSFDTLARFDPSLILELTATPQTVHNPPADKYASNILYSVSALELKSEEMIKLPIRLTTNSDWRLTIGAALDSQAMLEEAAKAEKQETGEYIRPIVLFQAQAKRGADPLTYDKLEKFLLEDQRINPDHIAVHTGTRKDLDGVDIMSPECAIRYIITVDKLKEGWDCPFAYILCSVADQFSPTAVEQLMGRVLRMPRAHLKRRDALNRAYAYVASESFDATAQKLKDGLVEGAGFNKLEVDMLIAPQNDLGFDEVAEEYEHESDPLEDQNISVEVMNDAIEKLPPALKSRLKFDPEKRSFSYKGPMTRENRNLLHLSLASIPSAEKTINRLYAKTNNIQLAQADDVVKPPFIVPLLGFSKQGELQLFSKEHYLDLPWRLDECDPTKITEKFRIVDESQSGEIDVSDRGQVEIDFVKRMQGELSAVIQEPAWTLPRLANWLDSGISHPDITKPSAIIFITGAIEALNKQGIDLELLARNKYDLRKALGDLIRELRGERQTGNYDALFASNAEQFKTSADLSIIFDEETYACNKPYNGGTKFNKHYTTLINDLNHTGEEFDCAVHIDRMEEVQFWIRNADRKKNAFWLQLPDHKFYPDFVVLLKDGRILVVEYKGGDRYESEAPKRHIGEVWAEASEGQCLFCMPTNRDFQLINRVIETQ